MADVDVVGTVQQCFEDLRSDQFKELRSVLRPKRLILGASGIRRAERRFDARGR